MKHAYESFREAADDYVDGESKAHRSSDHTPAECIGWMHGVKEFATWLDNVGIKIADSPDVYEKLWSALSPYRREDRGDARPE